jgi:hypothetical protein
MDLGRSIDDELIFAIDLAIEFDLAMETLNASMERESISTSQMEGAKNFTPLQIAQKVLTNPQITTLKPFDKFHCPRD